MKKIRFTPLFFRRIHKWVGLILGVQFLLWALSGSMMALLDQEKVGGHSAQASHQHALPAGDYIAPAKLALDGPVLGIALRSLATRPVYELRSTTGTRLIDATSGAPVRVDEQVARDVGE